MKENEEAFFEIDRLKALSLGHQQVVFSFFLFLMNVSGGID
jgi:hypothetical protein